MCFKRIISQILLLNFVLLSISVPMSAYGVDQNRLFHGHAQYDSIENSKQITENDLFTGANGQIKQRAVIEMNVSEVLSTGFTQEGDEFFAEVVNEVSNENGVLLPVGTIAHGKVRQVEQSKRLGRDGWLELSFDYLITPDGREITIEGQMTSKMHPLKGVTKTIIEDTGYTLAGSLVGGLAALNLFGIEAAIASHGYTLAGGAAIGGAVGLGISLLRKGKDVLISPGDKIKVKLLSSVDVPVMSSKALRKKDLLLEGLDVKITNISLESDPFGEKNTYVLSLIIKNDTEKNFSSLDIALMNDNGQSYFPSVFSENTLLFKTIAPSDRLSGKLSFAVDNPQRSHWLVFFDRKTRKPLCKISINNVMQDLKTKSKKKKKNY